MLRNISTVVLAALLATPVIAKDVCVLENDNLLTFTKVKVKSLKKPGTTIPLQGSYGVGGETCAVSGAATVAEDGSVWFGATAYCLLTPGVGKTILFGAHGSADFNAAAHTDRNGDGTVDTSDVWERVECGPV